MQALRHEPPVHTARWELLVQKPSGHRLGVPGVVDGEDTSTTFATAQPAAEPAATVAISAAQTTMCTALWVVLGWACGRTHRALRARADALLQSSSGWERFRLPPSFRRPSVCPVQSSQ